MNSAKLNEWLQAVASLGVIAGLIIVAYEINQNTALARAEHYRSLYGMWMDTSAVEIETDIGEVFVRSVDDPESLTPNDLFKLNAWYILVTSNYDNAARANEFGVASPTSIITESDAEFYFSSKYSRQWFSANTHWMRPENVEVISGVIQTTPALTEWKQVENMLYGE